MSEGVLTGEEAFDMVVPVDVAEEVLYSMFEEGELCIETATGTHIIARADVVRLYSFLTSARPLWEPTT